MIARCIICLTDSHVSEEFFHSLTLYFVPCSLSVTASSPPFKVEHPMVICACSLSWQLHLILKASSLEAAVIVMRAYRGKLMSHKQRRSASVSHRSGQSHWTTVVGHESRLFSQFVNSFPRLLWKCFSLAKLRYEQRRWGRELMKRSSNNMRHHHLDTVSLKQRQLNMCDTAACLCCFVCCLRLYNSILWLNSNPPLFYRTFIWHNCSKKLQWQHTCVYPHS